VAERVDRAPACNMGATAMDFLISPPGSFDAHKMALLQEVFDSAWSHLQAVRGARPAQQDAELKKILGQRIMAAAETGETDPATLCRTAIQGLFVPG
jgi:hypothetical protein